MICNITRTEYKAQIWTKVHEYYLPQEYKQLLCCQDVT